MPLKGEAKKKYNDAYYKKKRDEKEYAALDDETYRILHDVDPTGVRFLSEALSMAQLTELFNAFVLGQENLPEGQALHQWLMLRDRARKDLFWLGSVFDWHWYSHVHQATCDFFVQKNFDGVYHEGYTLKEVHVAIDKQDSCKHRLLLDPRYHYKTTIDSVDCIQWMINAPDARIFIVTAEEENSDDFVRQIKGYLYQPFGAKLTKFQCMFPEYVLRGREGSSIQPFISPARRHNQKDPTLWADSIMATLSTQHCDIMKADDVISNRNSDSETAREKLKKKFDSAIHLLDPWGFFDILGTRYSSDDWYGLRLKSAEEMAEAGLDNTLKIQVRSGMTVKEGLTEEGIPWSQLPLRKLKFHMVDLLFPELKATPEATFKHFMVDVFNNEMDFRCQILNQPAHDEDKPWVNPFTEELLTRSTCHSSTGPERDKGDLIIWWDTAITNGAQSDYCAGIVGQIWERPDKMWELFIWEIMADKMSTYELARNMVSLSKRWNPPATFYEKPRNLEVKDFESALNKERMLQQYYEPIQGVAPDPHADAKATRIKGLEVLFRLQLIKFAFGPWIDLAFDQFKAFTGIRGNLKRKDDIPDAIACLARRMPVIGVTPNPEGEKEMRMKELTDEAIRRRRMYDRIFGTSPYIPPQPNSVGEQEEPNPIYTALAPLSGSSEAPRAAFPKRRE